MEEGEEGLKLVLPRTTSAELSGFAETTEGHISQVGEAPTARLLVRPSALSHHQSTPHTSAAALTCVNVRTAGVRCHMPFQLCYQTTCSTPALATASSVLCALQGCCAVQVRWYSFQFLMEEIAEELEEVHAAMSALLPKLPRNQYWNRKGNREGEQSSPLLNGDGGWRV